MANPYYETDKQVSEYLAFHYGQDEADYMNFPTAPKQLLNFNVHIAERCAALAASSVGDGAPKRVLDVGCAVGRACFELANHFDEVVGVDFSQAFVNAANKMKSDGSMPYQMLEEGETYSQRVASVDAGVDRSRCTFICGDACNLPPHLQDFDVALFANLLCRLPDPSACLNRLVGENGLLKVGGHVVITSPFSWMEQFTPRDKWLGGRGEEPSADALKATMPPGMELVESGDGTYPFLIREHRRKFQLVFPHFAIFKRVA